MGTTSLMPDTPNIIILLLDTARAQSFSGYGYVRPTSPHIDALAAESTVYEQAIAPGCWSLPSQVSLLTGMFPAKHGAHELHLSYDASLSDAAGSPARGRLSHARHQS